MPKIYEYFGLIFYFYSNEHLPIHVHVTKSGSETIFELITENGKLKEIKKRKSKSKKPLSLKDEKEAVKFIKKFYKGIIEKWVKFFVYNKEVRASKITRKI